MTSGSPDTDEGGSARALLVLIVDDNERNRKLASDVLNAAGISTTQAATGSEVLALAVQSRPDVILLDLQLPDIDGADVARELRSDARTTHIPVVAFSALIGVGESEWSREAGFAGRMTKPIDVRTFPEQVRRYCKLRDT
jgi:two-component system cell cycle response regulator DivK